MLSSVLLEIKMDLAKFKEAFDESMGNLHKALEAQREDIKNHGVTTEQTVKALKKAEERALELNNEYTEIKKRMDAIEAKANRPAKTNGSQYRSLGTQFTESAEYKSWLEGGGSGNSRNLIVPEGMRPHQLKTLTTDPASAGDMIDPYRRPGIVVPPLRPLTIRNLLSSMSLSEGSVDYVEETQFNDLYTEVAVAGAAIDTDLVVDNANGFYPGQSVTIQNSPDIDLVIDAAGVDLDTNTLTFTAALGAIVPVDTAVVSETFVYTPETYLKPRANATYNVVNTSAKTLAHWIPATRQALSDIPALRSRIDTRLMQGIELAEEIQLLYGNGTTTEIQGIMTHPSVQSYAWSSGVVGDTQLDAIRRAMTLATLAHYPVDGIILNPSDKEDIDLLKGDDLHYIWVDVVVGGRMMLWSVPVVSTTAMNEGDFLVGAFGLGATIWDREGAMIRISESHADYFTRNMFAILAEKRMCLTVERPPSFVVGDFDSAPA